jgi:rare lipoprotein A (peptidoglycan hydrolase)
MPKHRFWLTALFSLVLTLVVGLFPTFGIAQQAAPATPMAVSGLEVVVPEMELPPLSPAEVFLPPVEEPTPTALPIYQTGIASWYGPGFHGNYAANYPERFDQDALTAAHLELPFNTIVEVKNLANGQVKNIRINDDGPHVAGRIIDLSRGSKNALGCPDLCNVELRIVTLGDGNWRR